VGSQWSEDAPGVQVSCSSRPALRSSAELRPGVVLLTRSGASKFAVGVFARAILDVVAAANCLVLDADHGIVEFGALANEVKDSMLFAIKMAGR
jgi:hypothetical protein